LPVDLKIACVVGAVLLQLICLIRAVLLKAVGLGRTVLLELRCILPVVRVGLLELRCILPVVGMGLLKLPSVMLDFRMALPVRVRVVSESAGVVDAAEATAAKPRIAASV
jgi:hypothetical protein